MPPTVNPVVSRRRAVQWRKRPGRRESLLAPIGGGTRKRSKGNFCTRRWISCLGCTSRRLYEVPSSPISKFRFDAIRPAIPDSHSVQRGYPGLPAASSSRDVQDAPESLAASPASPASPPHNRLDPPVTSPLTSPVITMETKKQPGAPQQAPSRRKGGGQQQLRSPVVKRPPAAPVTLQGWLHKQGSERFMLWKKRWFVLSEYCLFYYKGPEEEKLLGSILLPSYKISPCSTEGRVYRKFAFKAEHTNMRTYYFAADTRELMVQWMNALSLASILQEGSSWDDHQPGRPSVSSISSLLNQSADDSDSGFHGYRPQHSVTAGISSTVPGSSASKLSTEQMAKQEDASCQLNTSHDSVFSNGWGTQKQGGGYYQPLYANAPPKPRRLAEHEDYGASSPELSELAGKKTPQDPEGNKGFVPRIAQPQQPIRSESMDIRYHYHQAVGQTPVHSSQSLQQEQLQRLPQPAQQVNQGSGIHAQVVTNVERRTPDTYGRSDSTTAGPTGASKVFGLKGADYEDVYNMSDTMRHSGSDGSYGEVYKRSSSQVAYIKGAGPVISLHHKQYYSERGHRDNHPLPQGGGQYGHSGQHRQDYAPHRYASAVPYQQPDMQIPNMYSVPMQQQPLPPPLPPHHHNQSVLPVRRREARPNRYPPRPHSADFLDYDAKKHNQHYLPHPPYYPGQEADGSRDYLQHGGSGGGDKIYQEQHANRAAQLPRPKSSLEMMPLPDPSLGDNIYWSEEHYAQKMRQSASYVHQIPAAHARSHSSSSRATTPSIRLTIPTVTMSVDGGMKGGAQVGGVSSGGSVNSDCTGVVLRHPKSTELIQSDTMTLQSPSRQHCQQQQQRRWSEYRDPCSDGQFTRSASARLPRQRYQDDEIDSRYVDQQQKSTSDIRDGEKKIQQREESMKRLLEWKQRMLQSPLTRKPSGSSTRGTAQNELSKYYKQQVLRELATQEAQNRELINNQEIRGGFKRRSHLEDTGTVPGRSTLRSRSQDGRRSSTSLTRYNSYSSDDEEPSDVRKARKRVRRPSQAGRSRHGSAEGKPSRRHYHHHHHHHHHSSVPPLTCTDMQNPHNYENVTVPLNAKSHQHHLISGDSKTDTSESRISTGSLPNNKEEIPPDAAYGEGRYEGCSTPLRSRSHKGVYLKEQLRMPESGLTDLANGRISDKKLSELSTQQGETYHTDTHPLQKTMKCRDTFRRYSSSTVKSSGDSTSLQDERCSNEKHSDSGYDTLQASRVVPGFTEFLGVQHSYVNPKKSSELVYPVHEVNWDPSRVRGPVKNKEDWNMNLGVSGLMDLSFQCTGGNRRKGEEREDFIHNVESPPKNIVQSRIKAFETGKEGDESVLGRESLQMQEPLKLSPPMYHPNEAHVSSLRNTDHQHPPADEFQQHRKTDLSNFVFGDALSSDNRKSSETCHTLPKNTSESENNPKSVRDLLADFERKSQLVKERQAAEKERCSEGGPGKRCVFSDTETLLYDTSSDAEGLSEGGKQSGEATVERQLDESRTTIVYSDEDEDKDEEVAAALGRRERFFTSGRDLGRNIDPGDYGDRRHRKRKTSKSSLAATDPIAIDDLEVIVTPGYLRLSMAESVETHDDSESVCSTPTRYEQCKTQEKPGVTTKGKKSEGKCNALVCLEEHYMPMTPSKKAVLAPPDAFSNTRSPSASHTVIMENIFGDRSCEESSYVEMADDGLIRSLLAPEPNPSFLSKFDPKKINISDSAPTYATPESPRYCEIGSTGKENSCVTTHYEFLYKASTQYEPVYMEVSPLMEALKIGDLSDIPDTAQNEGGERRDMSDSTALHDISEKSKSGEEDGVESQPQAPPRTSLPDILNTASAQQKQQRKVLSKSDRDSSDADDEASKDLDSLDAPRHPRFSLSDTFRPASYYLGASSMSDRALIVLGGVAATTVEQHDSSDSDLVSPPPIPTSPLPLDDFDNSLELPETSLDINKQSQMPSTVGSETESNEKNESRVCEKAPGYTKSKTSDRHVGRLSSPLFLPPMYGTGDINSSGSESVDLRNEQDSKNIDRLLKRRPVSDDILGMVGVPGYLLTPYVERRSGGSDLESVGSRSGLAVDLDNGVSIDLDQYLEELQGKDAFKIDTCSKDVDQDCCETWGKDMHGINGNFDDTQQEIEVSPGSAKKFENPDVTVFTSNDNRCFPERGPDVRESVRSPDVTYSVEGDSSGLSSRAYELSPPRSEEVQYENLQMYLPPPLLHDNNTHDIETSEITIPFDGVIRRGYRATSNVEVHGLDAQHAGAPYYYSDLLKGEEDGSASSTFEKNVNSLRGYPCFLSNPATTANRVLSSASRVQPLNNQRENVSETSFAKRNDIGRKVNAIHQSPSFPAQSFPTQHVVSNKEESRLLAEELKSTTVHFLGAANKRGQVDERNLYEADTIQRRKGISLRDSSDSHARRYLSQTPDYNGMLNAVNLYPHGLRDKSFPLVGDESGRNYSRQPQRSRSLEGLIDDPNVLQAISERQSPSRSPRISRMFQSSGLTASLTNVPHSVASDMTQTHESRTGMAACVPTQYNQEHQGGMRNRPPPPIQQEVDLGPCEGDDLWEEDALWRESLRRVSLRHTRSLDNLDVGRAVRSSSRLSTSSVATSASTVEQSGRSTDLLSGGGCMRQKISRDVTYVNDSIVRSSHHRLESSRQREYEEDYREGRRRTRRRPQQSQCRVSDDVASEAERDDGVHYERLSRYSESLERTRRGQTFLEGYIWDEDQETFRKHQNDPASPQQQHQSQQQQHFLGVSSLPPQPPPQPPPSFEIDREKLRQWDLMSSAPLLQQQMLGASEGTPAVVKQPLAFGGRGGNFAGHRGKAAAAAAMATSRFDNATCRQHRPNNRGRQQGTRPIGLRVWFSDWA